MKMKDLTQKQRLFVESYLQTSNATESARRAGYAGNDNTLSQMGAKLVRNGKIQKYISKRVEKVAMSANEVLIELSKMARCDWRVEEKFKPSDKLKALELLGKHHKLFTDRIEHDNVSIKDSAIGAYNHLKTQFPDQTDDEIWDAVQSVYDEVDVQELRGDH